MLNPNAKKRPSATQVLEFAFFDQVKSLKQRTPSQTILGNIEKVNIKEVNQMRIKIANLEKINEILSNDNKELNQMIKKGKNIDSSQSLIDLKRANFILKEENKNHLTQIGQLKNDLIKVDREFNILTGKLKIKTELLEKLERDFKKSKDLGSYLFTNTKVTNSSRSLPKNNTFFFNIVAYPSLYILIRQNMNPYIYTIPYYILHMPDLQSLQYP